MGAIAQSKTTGSVSLQTGMTAELNLNNGTTTATLTLTGPSDRWFALQFGSFSNGQGMASGMDVVWYNGTTLVDGFMNGIGSAPTTDANGWTVSSNTVSGSTRTIVATRAFAGGTNDFTFNYNDANIDFAYARANSATYSLNGHGSFRGYKLNQAFTCAAPDAPTAAAQSFCGSGTVANLTATGGSGATFNWYTAATGGSALAGTTALSTGTYYVSQTISDCESTRTAVTVTVTIVATPVAQAAQSFCGSATVSSLTATATGGATLGWYAAATGGTALAGSTALVSGTTYYAGQTVNGCNSTRTAVTVTINNIPGAPGGDDTQDFDAGETLNDLAITILVGAQIQWYVLDEDVYVEIPATTPLVNGTTYYVSQTFNGCESAVYGITVSQTTGAEDFALQGLKAYPNPAGDVLTITNRAKLQGVSIINMLGQEVLSQRANGTEVQLNVAPLTGGSYIVKVTALNGATATLKIAKY
ncbi:hypothetical protein AM493_12430 [Flavobacterium akiainvivens]|uniref:Secretion system C-terminal sorting domain-containing protein n=2 Tax=Flavobacterium akiainvivens TaxID=1202724 RepID=A0A0M8MA27_9FLAO|nr:hypothetical protein AM493_12430 [Flavobacterium akiainvivens]